MRKDELDTLLGLISKLKPNEWTQIVLYVQKKYSSKQASVPMPSVEELSDYSVIYDFPGLEKSQMVQGQEPSTISVAVELTDMDRVNEELDKMLNKLEKANSRADELASKIKDLRSKKILSDDWKELIVEDAKTKEKLVIINSDGVEITSSDLNVRLVPKE